MKSYLANRIQINLIFLLIPLWSLIAQDIHEKEWEANFNKGQELINIEEYENAIPFLVNAYNIAKAEFEGQHHSFYKTANALANTYEKLGKKKKAIEFFLKALEGYELYGETVDFDYDIALYRLGINYRNIGDFDNSIRVLNKRLELIEKKDGKNNEEYINTLTSLSIAYKRKEDYPEATNLIKSSIRIAEKLFGKKNEKYVQNVTKLSSIYLELGEFEKGISILKSILPYYPEKNLFYTEAIVTLAELYGGVNEYEKQIELLIEAKTILVEYPRYFGYYIDTNNNLALAYDNLGDYENALTIALFVVENTSPDYPDYPTRMMNLGIYFTKLGEYSKAESAYEEALEARKKLNNTNHKLDARLIDVIGQHHYKKGNYKIAKGYFEEALPTYLKSKDFDENYWEYGRCLNYYATTLLELDQNDKAIDLLIKNINISKANSRTDREWFLRKQIALGKAYNKNGQFDIASAILQEFGEQFRQKLGVNHPDFADILHHKGKAYLGMGEIPKAVATLDTANTVLINQIDKVFKFRSEKEKHSFLRITNQNFDELQSIAFNLTTDSEALNKTNLNNQIMLKGLLLNNSKNILTQLSSLKNDDIDNKIIEYRTLKNLLSENLSLSFLDRKMDVDSLYEAINAKEAELVKIASSRSQTKTSLIGNWDSSKRRLRKNELAIEFSHFNLTANGKVTDSNMYVAYLYRSEWNAPVMISLFEKEELETIISGKSEHELYNSNELYNLICKPIEKYLESSKTIYYSPSGLLNLISFAGIKHNESTLSAKYNLVQLSNTGVLAEDLTEPGISTALFIGGITYDYDSDDKTKKIDSSYTYLNSESFTALRGTKTRGESWTYLPSTLREIENLQSILNSKEIASYLLSSSEAKETVLKEQSGNSPKILHIATHGYFFESNSTTSNDLSFGLSTEDHYRSAEDPLLRSGLLLAGANYAWMHGSNPYEEDDGILNAMEISNLDLSNTDIVVLSACETGLGDINGSEGVYGLQRAFKMAGVDIIVMSLWKVPDAETAAFMTLFYTNWIALKNVRQAFNETQRTMQKKLNNQPENWAAFVMFE